MKRPPIDDDADIVVVYCPHDPGGDCHWATAFQFTPEDETPAGFAASVLANAIDQMNQHLADVHVVADELADVADDRCGFCGVVVDRSTPEGETEGQRHDNHLCLRPVSASNGPPSTDFPNIPYSDA